MTRIKIILIGCLFALGIAGSLELCLRILTSVITVYDVEMIKYAKELKIASPYPEISHIHRPNTSANLMGVDVSLNSLGHRNPNLPSSKDTDDIRILMIGSSITLGWGVEEDKTIISETASRLNEELGRQTEKRFIGINAGVGNYNTVYSVELFKRQLKDTDPDVVVFQYYINDAEPNPVGANSILIKHSLLFALLSTRFQQMLFTTSSTSLSEYYENLYSKNNEGWKNAQAAFSELKQISRDRGIRLVVLLVPEMHNLSADSPYPPIYKLIEGLFDGMGVSFISSYPALSAAFAANPAMAWVAKDDPHPSAAAHKIISNILYDFLVTNLHPLAWRLQTK